MKDGVGSVLLYLLAGGLVLAGLIISVYPVVARQPHSDVQLLAGTGMVALGALFAAPASAEKAVEIIRPLVPWAKRSHEEGPS